MSEQSLISLSTQYQILLQKILENDGEILPGIDQELETISTAIGHKVDAYDFMMKKLDLEETFFKSQAEKYRAAAKRCAGTREWMKTKIKDVMRNLDKHEIAGNNVSFKLCRAASRLLIDETLLPDKYKMVETRAVPDKEKIAQDLELGHEIPGARFEDSFALRTSIKSSAK